MHPTHLFLGADGTKNCFTKMSTLGQIPKAIITLALKPSTEARTYCMHFFIAKKQMWGIGNFPQSTFKTDATIW